MCINFGTDTAGDMLQLGQLLCSIRYIFPKKKNVTCIES